MCRAGLSPPHGPSGRCVGQRAANASPASSQPRGWARSPPCPVAPVQHVALSSLLPFSQKCLVSHQQNPGLLNTGRGRETASTPESRSSLLAGCPGALAALSQCSHPRQLAPGTGPLCWRLDPNKGSSVLGAAEGWLAQVIQWQSWSKPHPGAIRQYCPQQKALKPTPVSALCAGH